AVQSTGSGAVSLLGKGGTLAGSQYGVLIRGSGGLAKGGSGSGTKLSIQGAGGAGGAGGGGARIGVVLSGAGVMATSGGGDVVVTGNGGASDASDNYGVDVGTFAT